MPDFQRLMQVVEQAMSLPPGDRSAYLRKECDRDESMLDAAKKVLAAEERAAGFLAPTLDSPAVHDVGQGLESRSGDEDLAFLRSLPEFRSFVEEFQKAAPR